MQVNRLQFDRANPNLWTWQIRHDRHTVASGFRRRADAVDPLGMISQVAMGEVEPCDVEARADEAFQHLRCVGGWPDRGHDFGFVLRERHYSSIDDQAPRRASYSRLAQSVSYR